MSKENIFDLNQEKETEEKDVNMPEGNMSPKYFKTNIEELNLLGDNGEGEGEPLTFIAQNDPSEFCIQKLDL